MSSSPGPSLGAPGVGVPSRRVSSSYVGLGAMGAPGTQPPRPLTPPIAPQHSPNSFLAGLSSRLISRQPRLPDMLDQMAVTGPIGSGAGGLLSFRNSTHNAFGVVGGSVGGPPTLDMNEFPSLGGSSGNSVRN